eukprot:7227369-Prymnesium_polylepis.1
MTYEELTHAHKDKDGHGTCTDANKRPSIKRNMYMYVYIDVTLLATWRPGDRTGDLATSWRPAVASGRTPMQATSWRLTGDDWRPA